MDQMVCGTCDVEITGKDDPNFGGYCTESDTAICWACLMAEIAAWHDALNAEDATEAGV